MSLSSQKTIVAINEVDFGSTGNIVWSLLSYFEKKGFKTYFCCHELTKNESNEFKIEVGRINYFINKCLSRIDASDGFHSKGATKKLISFLDKTKPDLLLLGNLHGSYLNLPILFKYIKDNNLKCVMTVHDCWSFTGKCAHFSSCGCDKWKSGCRKCPNLKTHPKAYLLDNTKKLFLKKKELFLSIKNNLTLVAPAKWLASSLKESYLKDFDIECIQNGIVLDTKTETVLNTDWLETKKIVLLSIGMPLINTKGLEYIERLSSDLPNDKFVVVTVGVPKKLQKNKNIFYLPHQTKPEYINYLLQRADYLLNPSLEDTFPTINLEALANGTKIIAFTKCGASEVVDENSGYRVDYKNYDALLNTVLHLNKKDVSSKTQCETISKRYNIDVMLNKYNELVERILSK